ncbi:MAG: hypothetical protein OWU33_04415 [Firmicutes bacterium]|nr:hypothetical protein [Bacillota bacterium]
MISRLSHAFLEAETAAGFRQFYALHLRTMRDIASGDPKGVLTDLEASPVTATEVTLWHSVYQPTEVIGIVDHTRHRAWIHPQHFAAGVLLVDPLTSWYSTSAYAQVRHTLPWHSLRLNLKECLTGALAARTQAEQQCSTDPASFITPVTDWITRYLSTPSSSCEAVDTHFFGNPLTGAGPYTNFLDETFRALQETVHIIACCHRDASALLRRFGEQALLRGYAVHYYHDALEPATINHLVLPQQQLGITHAEAPHLLPPGRHALSVTLGESPSHRATEWWSVFQMFYCRAWQIMEEIQSRVAEHCFLETVMSQESRTEPG